jgi:membrane protein required for colicin V production
VVSTVAGILRGLIREALGFVGLILSVVIAFTWAPAVAGVIGGRLGSAGQPAAFALLLLASMVVFAVLGRVLGRAVEMLNLGWVDRIFGAALGLGRGLVFSVVLLTIAVLVLAPNDPLVKRSRVLRAEAPAVFWLGTRLPGALGSRFAERWVEISGSANSRFVRAAGVAGAPPSHRASRMLPKPPAGAADMFDVRTMARKGLISS